MSEVKFSHIKSNDIFRFDSNYFQKLFLNQEQRILNTKSKQLIDFDCDIKSFGAYSLNNYVEYLDEGVPFVRGINLKGGRINFNDVIYISNEAHKLLWKSEVTPEAILLSMSGTIGDVAIASKSLKYPINSNQDIAKIRCGENLNPYYLYAFLSSCFGQNYLIREARGSVQQHVFLSQIEKFQIPEFSDFFYNAIEITVKNADLSDSKSQQRYAQAEQILLEAVGLADFTPSTQNTNIKTFAQSFGTSSRLDAEYYQPKYEDYLKLIFNYKEGWSRLNEICELKDTNFIPIDEVEYQYIELSDIDKSGGITGCSKDVGANLPSRARRFVNASDVVISSIEGSLSSCALVPTNYNNALCSTGFYVIKSQTINSETLLVLMKSELMQNILKQNCSGTILTAMNKDEFSNLPIPKIDIATQAKISQPVQQSFSLKAQSEHLLSVAKRAVEVAIEQDESAGLAYIKAQTRL